MRTPEEIAVKVSVATKHNIQLVKAGMAEAYRDAASKSESDPRVPWTVYNYFIRKADECRG